MWLRRYAFFLIVIVDVGFLAWGGMAALAPDHLLGPGGLPILAAEYQNFTGGSWPDLVASAPRTVLMMTVIYRVYGAFNVAFGFLTLAITLNAFRRRERWAWWAILIGHTIALGAAITFDRVMKAIGPFEVTEYLGLVMIFVACGLNTPVRGES